MSIEDKKTLLVLVCSNITLKDQKLATVYREPYASLANFPLACIPDETASERKKLLIEAERPEIVEKWLGILTVIRTVGIPEWAH